PRSCAAAPPATALRAAGLDLAALMRDAWRPKSRENKGARGDRDHVLDRRSVMTELIHQYGGWGGVILVFLEAVGLAFPGETILVTAAIYAGTTQNLSIGLVLFAAVAGATLGSIIGFWIGDRYGYPLLLRYGGYAGLTEARIKIGQYLFQRYGMGVVLVARFVAVLRSLAAIVAGASRMPFVS